MTFEQFIEKLAGDAALAENISKAESPEKAYELAKTAGLGLPYDEFVASMKKINDANNDMSAADVDTIVGGVSTTDIVKYVGTGVGVASAVSGTVVTAAAGAAV